MYDSHRLGRGALGSLSEDNFEYGDWTPMTGSHVSKRGGEVAESKSDSDAGSLYYPLSEAVEVRPASRVNRNVDGATERSSNDNADATGKRNTRDCEYSTRLD